MSVSQILITEDESVVALDIEEALKSSDYGVAAVANSGREALEKVAETRPDLVLMDIRLKGDMDGVQAGARIRERYDIPVIYLTAYSDHDTVQRAKLTEPFGYLHKPFEKRELQIAIEVALYKHKMEREIKESRRWLAAILAGTGDAIVAADEHGLINFMNAAGEAFTGWTSAEARGKLWTDVVRVFEGEEGHPGLKAEFLKGEAGNLSPRAFLFGRDGARRPVDGNIAPIREENGKIAGFVLALRDVTERRRLEEELLKANRDLEKRVEERTEALAASESKFRSMAETAPDGVVVTDDEGKIVFCNRGAQELFGASAEDLGGQSFLSLIPERHAALVKTEARALLADGRPRRFSLQGRDRPGREFPVEISVSTWTSGEKRFYTGLVRDVSDRWRMEGMLFHAERLAVMGQMAAGIARELKTPLGVIFGFTDVLTQRYQRGEDATDMLDTLKRQASRCSNLVNSLLTFSRKDPRPGAVEERVDVNAAAEAALSLLGPHATGKSVEVRRELSPDGVRVRGSREMLEQVLVSLVLNAVESMPQKGTLVLSTRRAGEGREARVNIEVSDSGEGMRPEDVAHVFDPFFMTKEDGTGLGLWLVKQIVSGLGGEISCGSEAGKGTVFSLSFPSVDEVAQVV